MTKQPFLRRTLPAPHEDGLNKARLLYTKLASGGQRASSQRSKKHEIKSKEKQPGPKISLLECQDHVYRNIGQLYRETWHWQTVLWDGESQAPRKPAVTTPTPVHWRPHPWHPVGGLENSYTDNIWRNPWAHKEEKPGLVWWKWQENSRLTSKEEGSSTGPPRATKLSCEESHLSTCM